MGAAQGREVASGGTWTGLHGGMPCQRWQHDASPERGRELPEERGTRERLTCLDDTSQQEVGSPGITTLRGTLTIWSLNAMAFVLSMLAGVGHFGGSHKAGGL